MSLSYFYASHKLGKLTQVEKFIVYTGPTMETEDGKALNLKDLDLLLQENDKNG
jgi:hypothetical protein